LSERSRGHRQDYLHFLTIPTRWMDNDLYGHVNNVVYYAWFDTVINEYLIRHGGLDIHGAGVIGVCAESSCRYHAAVAYPDPVDVGLRVEHLGGRSVRYGVGVFPSGLDEAAAEGWFVHVFVDRESLRPAPVPGAIRAALARLLRSA
jgi:acyl-CoA thioester hydrolase